MRPSSLAVASLFCIVSPALAGPAGGGNNGGGSGGGALSQVSGGIRDAGGGSSGGGGGHTVRSDERDLRYDDRRDVAYYPTNGIIVTEPAAPVVPPRPNPAKLDMYVGAQKVHDSDGALSVELAVVDRHFRLAGALSHYFEDQEGGGRLTMTMPSLMLGLRLDDGRGPRAFLEGGVVHASTKADPVMDSSITGAIVGAHFEQPVAPTARLIVDAHVLSFKHDIRAYSGRLGVRFGNLQASFRVLDFNVGPALYGPELGLAF